MAVMKDQSYRDLFADMPPMEHSRTREQSEVVSYIARKLDCDLEKAESVFKHIRHARRRIVLHDRARGVWYGERHVNAPDAIRRLRARVDELEAAMGRLTALECEFEKMRKWAIAVNKRTQN